MRECGRGGRNMYLQLAFLAGLLMQDTAPKLTDFQRARILEAQRSMISAQLIERQIVEAISRQAACEVDEQIVQCKPTSTKAHTDADAELKKALPVKK